MSSFSLEDYGSLSFGILHFPHPLSFKKLYIHINFICKIYQYIAFISLVQSLSHVWLFATPWTAAHQASLSITDSWSLLKFMSMTLMMPSNHLILCRPLLLPPLIFPGIRVFSNESFPYNFCPLLSHCFHCFPIYLPWSDGTGCHDLSFLNVEH